MKICLFVPNYVYFMILTSDLRIFGVLVAFWVIFRWPPLFHKVFEERALLIVTWSKNFYMKPMIYMLCNVFHSIRLVFGLKTSLRCLTSILTNVSLPGDQLLEVFKNENFQSPFKVTFTRATSTILQKFYWYYEPSKLAERFSAGNKTHLLRAFCNFWNSKISTKTKFRLNVLLHLLLLQFSTDTLVMHLVWSILLQCIQRCQ